MLRRSIFTLLCLVFAAQVSAAELVKVREPVPDSYIVVLKDDVNVGLNLPLVGGLVEELVGGLGGTLLGTFDNVLKGFSLKIGEADLSKLLDDPRVEYVEQNAKVTLAQSVQNDPAWGLDRIDQRALPLDDRYSFNNAGAGAHIYIIDSGLRTDHQEFSGRVGNGVSTVGDNRGVSDCGGHGTSVAGVAAGRTYGVAKRATVHPVRVVDCNGVSTSADIIAGIDWIVANQQRPAIVNISLGSVASRSTVAAVQNATARGLLFTVAAGNQNADACAFSPANSDVALTVGASTREDARAGFSNRGQCVDLFAPGENILSAGADSASSGKRFSGTSLASPFAAGVAAVYRANNAGASPSQVMNVVLQSATENTLNGIGAGSPNRLLYVQSGNGNRVQPDPEPPAQDDQSAPPPANPPSNGEQASELKARFRYECQALTCRFDATPSVGNATAYGWKFGDGSTGSGTAVNHSFQAPGEYRVLLRVTNAQGEQALGAAEVNVQGERGRRGNLCDVPLVGGLCR